MKIKGNYVYRNIANEHLLIPTGEAAKTVNGLIALSESGSLLYRKLQNECTREELVAAILNEYEVTEEVAAADIEAFLVKMRELDMLAEE